MKILKMPLKEILLKIYRKPKLIVLNYLITNSDLKGKKWFAKYFNKIKLLNTAEGGGYLICKYIEKNNIISLKESNSESMIYIGSPYRVFHYNGGIIDRYKRLANDYLLDKDLIQFNNNDIIIDIGANVGELGLYFKKIINVKIQYHAFEPGLEEYYANQCNNFTDNDYINNLALGDETGTIKLYNKNKSGDSSIFPIKNYESISQVNILTLDEYINQNGITTIKLIKLEAEGAEPEIIRGAIKSLEITQYITADLGYERGILQEETFSNCTNFLIRNNFLLIGININQSRLVGLFEKEKK